MRITILVFALFLASCSVLAPLQRSKFIGVFHLIENEKFEEAKELVEDMIADNETSQWSRTWYARGLLAEKAWLRGKNSNESKYYELYPDQLFLAIASYERARLMRVSIGFNRKLAPSYVVLVNEFKKEGQKLYNEEDFEKSLRAFEQAIRITEGPVLRKNAPKELVFNAAMAAKEMENTEKTLFFLKRLDEKKHHPNISHLLFDAHLNNKDTLQAKQTLLGGIEHYEENENLILLFVELKYKAGDVKGALDFLDEKLKDKTKSFELWFAKGLMHQKQEQYSKAIKAYTQAAKLKNEDVMTHINIATSYYNMALDFEEESRTYVDSQMVSEKRNQATAGFDSAIHWLDKAYQLNPQQQRDVLLLFQLYNAMGERDKAISLQRRLN